MRSIRFLVCLISLGALYTVPAVDGVAVSVKGHNWYIYGPFDGQLWRHDIVNSKAVRHTLLDNGPCSRAVLSPDGRKVAFVRKNNPADTCPLGINDCGNDKWFNFSSAKICVMDINGAPGSATVLASCDMSSVPIDFPSNNYVYFMQSGPDDKGGCPNCLKRVSMAGVAENVANFAWGVIELNISNDLTKAVIRTNDHGSREPKATIIGYNFATGNGTQYHSLAGTTNPSCGAGISCDGLYAFDGWIDHDGMDVRNWSDGTIVKSYSNANAFAWAPNTVTGLGTTHKAWSSSGSTNSNKWFCVMSESSGHQLLINWLDQQCIVATEGMTPSYAQNAIFEAGDFWVGTPPATGSNNQGISRIENTGVAIQSKTIAGNILSLTIDCKGVYTVTVADISGRTLWSAPGNGKEVYSVPRAAIASGIHIVRVKSAGRVWAKVVSY